MSTELAFGVVAALAVIPALLVISSANLVRAVLWLGVTLVATAALYAMLGASFLAGVQLLLYVGGVMTLMVFGVMITRRHEGIAGASSDAGNPVRGVIAGTAVFALLSSAIITTPGLDEPPAVPPPVLSIADLGRQILHDQILAFEVLSVLLLAAIIGAVVIARRHDPGAVARRTAAAPTPASEPSPAPPAKVEEALS